MFTYLRKPPLVTLLIILAVVMMGGVHCNGKVEPVIDRDRNLVYLISDKGQVKKVLTLERFQSIPPTSRVESAIPLEEWHDYRLETNWNTPGLPRIVRCPPKPRKLFGLEVEGVEEARAEEKK